MKDILILSALVIAICLIRPAVADEDLAGPTQDLTPVSLSFQRVSVGEVEHGQLLRIIVVVKNVGTLPVRGSRGGVIVGSISNPNTALYGPNGLGGYNLGAPIPPGQLGQFLLYARLGSLTHCQKVRVSIDTAHTLQSGSSLVFYNDSRILTAIDTQSILACVGGIHP